MVALYMFLVIVYGVPMCLLLGGLYKIVTYPRKQIFIINEETDRPVLKWVDDTDYNYRPEELWELPNQNWQPNIVVPKVKHIIGFLDDIPINQHGDDDWATPNA